MRNPRIALANDAPSIARVHVAAWQTIYRGIVSDEVLDGLSSESLTDHWTEILSQSNHHTFVVEEASGGIVGFADGGPERRGDLGFTGELYSIHLLHEHRGRGIGKMLLPGPSSTPAARRRTR